MAIHQLEVQRYMENDAVKTKKSIAVQNAKVQIGLWLLDERIPDSTDSPEISNKAQRVKNDKFFTLKSYIRITSKETSALTAQASMVV